MILRTLGTITVMALAAACTGERDADSVPVGEVAANAPSGQATATTADTVVVYKSPTCGCCNKWVDHIRENGFVVVTHDLDNDNLDTTKRTLGVPAGHASCHTATVKGYTIEGHVPADLIRRLIAENPRGVRGLTVPGMPMGSPGMEGIIRQEYEVLSFDEQGNVDVYERR